MNVELCIPEPALHERAEQWIRETLEKLTEAHSKVTAIQRALQGLGSHVAFSAPAEDELRTEYEKAEHWALGDFKIQPTPFAAHPLHEVFQMAVTRGFTFEETKGGVVGLQDCVILLSVFEHLRAKPALAALVSKDAVFSRIPGLAPAGVELRLISGLEALEKVLDEAHNAAFNDEFRRFWSDTTAGITGALTTNRERVKGFIVSSVDRTDFEKLFPGKMLTAEQPTIETFGVIRPDFKGDATDPIAFSCDVSVSFTATVERVNLLALAGLQTPFFKPPPTIQVTEQRTATVEQTAHVTHDYSQLTLETARLRE
jgi:hypothetical protein